MPLEIDYDYAECVRDSEKVSWKLDDVLPARSTLDLSRPLLPEGLARMEGIGCLDVAERLTLNQIMGNAYLNLFGFVEEYIIGMATEHAHAELFGDSHALRALLRFSDEELKHQELFQRYRAAFERDFGPTDVLGNAVEVAGIILAKAPIAVMLTTLHLELVTQQHFVSSVRDATGIDPLFVALLKHHWIEESQHVKIDILELERMLATATADDVRVALNDYRDVCDAFVGLLDQQAAMDIESLGRKTGRRLAGPDAERLVARNAASYRHMFLRVGMEHPRFLKIISAIAPGEAERVRAHAALL